MSTVQTSVTVTARVVQEASSVAATVTPAVADPWYVSTFHSVINFFTSLI